MKKYITSLEIKWALIFFTASLFWMVFEKQMGWHDMHIDKHALYSNIFAIVAIAVYVFALINKRNKHYNRYITWRQGFTCGMVITVLVTIMAPVTQYITSEYITPDYFKNVIEYAVNKEGRDRVEMEKYFNLNSYIVQSTVATFVMGLMTSAVVAIFVKRNPPTD